MMDLSFMPTPPRTSRTRSSTTRQRLTARQLRFVEEYLVSLNATQACIQAGYSAKTAESAGPRLLGNVGVARAIADAQQARAMRVGITQDRVLAELEELAFSSLDHYLVNEEGNVILAPNAPPRALRAVASIKRQMQETPGIVDKDGVVQILRGYEVEIKLWDKPSMLKLAGNHVGILREGQSNKRGAEDVPLDKLSDETLAALHADLDRRKKP
jgi:phage terminase small subunit